MKYIKRLWCILVHRDRQPILELEPQTFTLLSVCARCKQTWTRDMMTMREMIRIVKWATERGFDSRDLVRILPSKKDKDKQK